MRPWSFARKKGISEKEGSSELFLTDREALPFSSRIHQSLASL
jgi:hypothetical protein